jgi:2-dehydropantoate 2-reductase
MDFRNNMRIAVIGAGAIGNLVAAYLCEKGESVSLIGRPESVEAIKQAGLHVSGVRGNLTIPVNAALRLQEKPDLAILAVKTQDVEQALRDNAAFLEGVTILTTQNGVRTDSIVAEYVPKESIIASIVMFGATYLAPARVVHNFEGNWVVGKMFSPNDPAVDKVRDVCDRIFPTLIGEDIKGMKYLKIFLNANNCIPAILGSSMQEAFSDPEVSRLSIAIWQEGYDIVQEAGIALTSVAGFPLERLTGMLSMPCDQAAKLFSGIMVSLSQEPLYGSILQSIKRNRPSEIDYLNGEFVAIAAKKHRTAPLNQKLVDMVHQVEHTNTFFTKEALLEETAALLP